MILELSLKLTGGHMSIESGTGRVSTVTVDGLQLPMCGDFVAESVRGVQTFRLTYLTPEACAAAVEALKKGPK